MKEQFRDFIYKRVNQAQDKPDNVEEILSIFSEKTYKKGEVFKENNTIIRELGFLTKGSARSYIINNNGDDITREIILENHLISDIMSVRWKKENPIIIEFLESSQVVSAPMGSVMNLLQSNLIFNILIREYMGDRAAEVSLSMLMFITGTAKERYEYIIENNPDLVNRFPLRFIASMIGITPTQLSRIRSDKS